MDGRIFLILGRYARVIGGGHAQREYDVNLRAGGLNLVVRVVVEGQNAEEDSVVLLVVTVPVDVLAAILLVHPVVCMVVVKGEDAEEDLVVLLMICVLVDVLAAILSVHPEVCMVVVMVEILVADPAIDLQGAVRICQGLGQILQTGYYIDTIGREEIIGGFVVVLGVCVLWRLTYFG